ncbi:uncharacterized protein BDCG_17549 [Blastomyces dermatitidis ER-3]|uniref:Uncharacterized protein n=1 Tax=Ajellomyces dermatitidis (strain ER-3 / ATCC MYA-2586) TaxID=559297 RepID=A0ABX2VZ57_AJEDR|nr:uncharacterized protein BDCG_17549 [Blastomyces dermatitidis ER-3]OAT02432.1 hypothetical protein BDCG_17549 [Blastomyces dermatitidis ER-3]
MSDTPVTSEFSSRPRTTRFTRQLIDRMITYYEEASDLQDEAEISFHQSMEFDDETMKELQNKEKQSQHSSAESVHFNPSNSPPSLTPGMPTFNDDPNQPIYCTAGNLMNLMQMMLQNQMTAAETTQHLTTSAQRDTTRDELQEYQKKVKYALDIKSVTTFDDSNYKAWHVDMLTDVKVIDEINILLRTQQEFSFTHYIDSEKWRIHSKSLYRCMLSSLVGNRYFCYLVTHHKELCQSTENIYHDLFLNNLQDYQRLFVKTHLNEFFFTSQRLIINIDIDDLMKQLINCTFKKIITEQKKQPQADSVTVKKNKNKDKDKDEDKSTPV